MSRTLEDIVAQRELNRPTFRGKLAGLCNGIVEQAARDWMDGYIVMIQEFGEERPKQDLFQHFTNALDNAHGKTEKYRVKKKRDYIYWFCDADDFIGSDWYNELTDISGDYLKRIMKETCNAYINKVRNENGYEFGPEKFHPETV